jgi:ubiquinone/menaquinone biosynthesis C-methylase UbiE
MKVRDSGMPPETMWSGFFDVDSILNKMQVNQSVVNLLEVGCGYGTFTINSAKRISGKLSAFDIEQEMIDYSRNKAHQEGLTNIEFFNRDIIAEGSGLEKESIDYVMLFNILHHDKPMELLNEAHHVLYNWGRVGIIHWRSDIDTPRGPDVSIRPKPDQCIEWAKEAGFKILLQPQLLEPFHFGLIIQKS